MFRILCSHTALIFFVVVIIIGDQSEAEDLNFLGNSIHAQRGTFLVTKKAIVRAGPMTESKKLGVLEIGEEVHVVGRAKNGAEWMAIQKKGTDYGFVYEPILLPKIEGTLEESVSGVLKIQDGEKCKYTFIFDDKNIIEDEKNVFSDYEVTYVCRVNGKLFRLLAAMFISEVPFLLTREPVFQISIDLMEVEKGYDEIFSTIFEYRQIEKKVVFVGISLKDLARIPEEKVRRANSVVEALKAAVEMAPSAWGEGAWKQIQKAHFGSD